MGVYKDFEFNSSKIGKIKQWPLFASLMFGYLAPINSTLMTISNLLISLTFVMQLATSGDYLIKYSKAVKQLKQNNDAKVIEEKDEILFKLDMNNSLSF